MLAVNLFTVYLDRLLLISAVIYLDYWLFQRVRHAHQSHLFIGSAHSRLPTFSTAS